MEDTLGEFFSYRLHLQRRSLNPCFNGRYSRRRQEKSIQIHGLVLILVLMEDTLGGVKEIR